MKTISVIIPSYNSSLTIGQTIKEVSSQNIENIIKEIIIVDSSDDLRTRAILHGIRLPNVKIIESREKIIPAISRNIGAKEARGDILVFIDADAYPEKNWVRYIIKANENGCKVGGGSVLLPNSQKSNFIAIAQYFLQFNEYLPYGDIREMKFVPSCNLFCERALFYKIGGFPDYRAAEDVLFGLKANEIEKVWFIPEIKIYHIFRKNIISFLKNQMLLGEYVIIYRRKNYGGLVYSNLIPLLLLPGFLFVKIYISPINFLLTYSLVCSNSILSHNNISLFTVFTL